MTESEDQPPPRDPRGAAVRILAAVGIAIAVVVGVSLLLGSTKANESGLVSLTFLLLLPAAVSAFVSYVADPWGRRSQGFYLAIPAWIFGIALVVGVVALREGAVCIVMAAPLWFVSGMLGSFATYAIRRRLSRGGGRVYSSALLIAPLLAFQAEAMAPPPPVEAAVVTRSIVIDAPPERVWPLLRDIRDVRPGEGLWNLSQDVIGVPRPTDARLVGEGIGADRMAAWDRSIRFRERITEWQPGRRIGWRFQFDDPDAWDITDRHLRPTGPYFRILTGGYTLTPLASGRTRVDIETRYSMRSPLNGYAALWGEVFLGDIQNNLLAIIAGRAERS